MQAPITIALVDDFIPLRKVIAKYLANNGFIIVCEADNGQAFINHLTQCNTVPDLCLLDIQMPVMDGYETASRLKDQYPSVGILAHSSCDAYDDIQKIIYCGADGFISKGSLPTEVGKALMDVYQMIGAIKPNSILKTPVY